MGKALPIWLRGPRRSVRILATDYPGTSFSRYKMDWISGTWYAIMLKVVFCGRSETHG